MVNKRYLISVDCVQNDAVISRALTYLSKMNNVFVTTPIGADIIKLKGGGQNYVHDGSSLQEMIVPVIKVKTFTRKQNTGMVNVELSSFTSKITSIEVRNLWAHITPSAISKEKVMEEDTIYCHLDLPIE